MTVQIVPPKLLQDNDSLHCYNNRLSEGESPMNSKLATRSFLVAVVISICLSTTPPLLAQQAEDSADARTFSPRSAVFGMTYGDWAAAFWQWEASLPLSKNPAVTGTNCLIGQENGPVFFAPASFGGSMTVSCTIPARKAIFITVLTDECSTVEPAPFHGSNPQELRNCNGAGTDPLDPNTLTLTVDNKPVVRDLRPFRVQTPSFKFIMPSSDNFLHLPGVASATSELDGYFVMLQPLPKGQHVIHSGGSFTSGPPAGFTAFITLNLTVE
jgi:hypothetical protein